MQDKYEALAELMKDEETAKAIAGNSPEQAVVNLKARGLDFTAEELNKLADDAVAAETNDSELNEDALDNVSGGVVGAAIVAVGVGLAWLWGRSKRKKK